MSDSTLTMRELYDLCQRQEVWISGMERVVTRHVVRCVSKDGDTAMVLWQDLPGDPAAARKAVADELAWCRANVKSLNWKVYGHDLPGELGGWLQAEGGEPEDRSVLHMAHIPGLLQKLAARRASAVARMPPTLRAGYSRAQILSAQATWINVWPESADEQALWGEVYASEADRWNAEAAKTGDQDPGTCFWTAHAAADPDPTIGAGYAIHGPPANAQDPKPNRPIALLCGGAVRESARGQGAYSALLAARTRWAAERGAEYMAIEASPMSAPIVQSLGFAPITPLVFYKFDF